MALRWLRWRALAPSDLACGGVVVDLEEDAVDAGGDGGAGEDGDELGLAAGDSVGG